MDLKRLFFIIMVICFASGIKAQFYDGPDDIYYYVEEYYEHDEYKSTSFNSGYYTGRTLRDKPENNQAMVMIFNFDGNKAACLGDGRVSIIKSNIAKNPSYYEDKIETTEYKYKYVSTSTSGVTYKLLDDMKYIFSKDRNTLKVVYIFSDGSHPTTTVYKRVNKSDFKVGRSRTPSGTIYE